MRHPRDPGKVKECARQVRIGELLSPNGPFTDLLVIGIGGSALGPQFVGKSLRPTPGMTDRSLFRQYRPGRNGLHPIGIGRTWQPL